MFFILVILPAIISFPPGQLSDKQGNRNFAFIFPFPVIFLFSFLILHYLLWLNCRDLTASKKEHRSIKVSLVNYCHTIYALVFTVLSGYLYLNQTSTKMFVCLPTQFFHFYL